MTSRPNWLLVVVFAALVCCLCWNSTNAADRARVQAAIKRGVEFLQREQEKNGAWNEHREQLGITALATLALIESGVDLTDESVAKGLKLVRAQAARSTHNYSVALAIMVLDRAGDRQDQVLIRALGERMAEGQNSNGSWSYWVPSHTGSENLARRAVNMAGFGDNSNTQFAVLGLWVARRHGAKVDDELQNVADYFRKTVSKASVGSGWHYGGIHPVTPSMTCAGLVALATGHGVHSLKAGRGQPRIAQSDAKNGPNSKKPSQAENRDPAALRDPLVVDGLKYLESHLQDGPDLDWYFHWSLERVGVIFDLPKIGRVDWYEWSSNIAVDNQGNDGSWRNKWGSVAETSFVLLVLNRANVASDLTRIVGAGQSQLTAGTDIADLKKRASAAVPQPADSTAKDDSLSLMDKLLRAPSAQQRKLLAEIRDKKGGEYSTVLVDAIEKLDGEIQAEAREYLTQRFTRLTANSLRAKLGESAAASRAAAAQAVERKSLRELVPDLIDLLTDKNADVAQKALTALRKLTNEDFGPSSANPTLAERFSAKKKWKNWAAEQPFGNMQ